MVAIVDYGVGNLFSLQSSFQALKKKLLFHRIYFRVHKFFRHSIVKQLLRLSYFCVFKRYSDLLQETFQRRNFSVQFLKALLIALDSLLRGNDRLRRIHRLQRILYFVILLLCISYFFLPSFDLRLQFSALQTIFFYTLFCTPQVFLTFQNVLIFSFDIIC